MDHDLARLLLLLCGFVFAGMGAIWDRPLGVAVGCVAILAAAIWREGKDD